LTCAKTNGEEGRPAVARTADGGLSWEFLSYIGPEPGGFSIMPSGVRLSESRLVAAVRRREGTKRWIEAYKSSDNGSSWDFLSIPVADTGEGNPPCLIHLQDGRICLTYGYRGVPSAIRARLSSDGGETWGSEITLRDHAPEKDVGYTRSVQRLDGKIVTVYFFHNSRIGERYIEAAIWDPDQP
ncbi:MAG: glycoside hydrolase, partial [Verrucomicrobiae bacterium]|nr:glycoside hydrolase [Verrucomicrobiae bacterium]